MKNLFLIVSCLFLFFGNANACSCVEKFTVEASYGLSNDIFTGILVKKENLVNEYGYSTYYKCTFEVKNSWKGGNSDYIVVKTPINESACGFDFQLDKEYLVYASQYDGNSLLRTDACTRTTDYIYAQDDIALLNLLKERNRNTEHVASLEDPDEEVNTRKSPVSHKSRQIQRSIFWAARMLFYVKF